MAYQYRSAPLQLLGSTLVGRVIYGTDLAECVSVPGDFHRPQGFFPLAFTLFRGGWIYFPVPEAPLIRAMPTGLLAFLKMPSECALRPCALTHQKKALHHTCVLGGADLKYRFWRDYFKNLTLW